MYIGIEQLDTEKSIQFFYLKKATFLQIKYETNQNNYRNAVFLYVAYNLQMLYNNSTVGPLVIFFVLSF